MAPQKTTHWQWLGCTLIIVGTAIGAGMLALPILCAGCGFVCSLISLLAIWALMTLTGLLVLEISLHLQKRRNNFDSMAKVTLGLPGQIIMWLNIILLLYALSSAYIAGNTSLLQEAASRLFGWHWPSWSYALAFTLLFGGIVTISTAWVDQVNRYLISAKGIGLIIVLSILMPHISTKHLLPTVHHATLLLSVPIFITAFGYHTVIPSLINYLGPQPKQLRCAIVVGTTVALVLYLLWLLCTLGTLPYTGPNSFEHIQQHHDSLGLMVDALIKTSNNQALHAALTLFTNIAMTTSFLGVTLGLFDFVADACKRPNNRRGRLSTSFITFMPPLLFAVFYPNGFVLALKFSTIFLAMVCIILPAIMAYQIRRQHPTGYRVIGGTPLLIVIAAIGVVLIGIDLVTLCH